MEPVDEILLTYGNKLLEYNQKRVPDLDLAEDVQQEGVLISARLYRRHLPVPKHGFEKKQ